MGASRYVDECADRNSAAGYTIQMDYSSFLEELLELRENNFQVRANGVPEKTNLAFPDITDQLPSRHKLSCRFCWTSVFSTSAKLYKMPENTGTVY